MRHEHHGLVGLGLALAVELVYQYRQRYGDDDVENDNTMLYSRVLRRTMPNWLDLTKNSKFPNAGPVTVKQVVDEAFSGVNYPVILKGQDQAEHGQIAENDVPYRCRHGKQRQLYVVAERAAPPLLQMFLPPCLLNSVGRFHIASHLPYLFHLSKKACSGLFIIINERPPPEKSVRAIWIVWKRHLPVPKIASSSCQARETAGGESSPPARENGRTCLCEEARRGLRERGVGCLRGGHAARAGGEIDLYLRLGAAGADYDLGAVHPVLEHVAARQREDYPLARAVVPCGRSRPCRRFPPGARRAGSPSRRPCAPCRPRPRRRSSSRRSRCSRAFHTARRIASARVMPCFLYHAAISQQSIEAFTASLSRTCVPEGSRSSPRTRTGSARRAPRFEQADLLADELEPGEHPAELDAVFRGNGVRHVGGNDSRHRDGVFPAWSPALYACGQM